MRPAARGHGACWGLRHSPVPAGDGPWSGKTGVLSRYGMLVFFLKKIQKENCKFLLAYFPRCAYTRLRHGGSSSVGRAPGCGPGGRGFKSHLSPHKKIPPLSSGVFLFLPPAYGLTGHQRPCTETRAGRRTGPALGLCARKGMCRVRRGVPAAVMGAVACVKDVPRPQGWAPVRGRQLPGVRERPEVLFPQESAFFPRAARGPCGLWTGRPCQSRAFCVQNIPSRSVAQHGSAPALGAGGRWFESSRSDHKKSRGHTTGCGVASFFCRWDQARGPSADVGPPPHAFPASVRVPFPAGGPGGPVREAVPARGKRDAARPSPLLAAGGFRGGGATAAGGPCRARGRPASCARR